MKIGLTDNYSAGSPQALNDQSVFFRHMVLKEKGTVSAPEPGYVYTILN
jgi:hypothetical protein